MALVDSSLVDRFLSSEDGTKQAKLSVTCSYVFVLYLFRYRCLSLCVRMTTPKETECFQCGSFLVYVVS